MKYHYSIKSLLQNEIVYRKVTKLPFTTATALVWQSNIQSSVAQAFVDFVKDSVIPIIR